MKILYGPPLCPGTTTGVPHFGLILYGLEHGLTAKICADRVTPLGGIIRGPVRLSLVSSTGMLPHFNLIVFSFTYKY